MFRSSLAFTSHSNNSHCSADVSGIYAIHAANIFGATYCDKFFFLGKGLQAQKKKENYMSNTARGKATRDPSL